MGLYSMVFSAAAVTAPAGGMFVYDRIGPDAVWWIAAAAALPLAAACLVLAPRLRGAAPDITTVSEAGSVHTAHQSTDRPHEHGEHDAASDARDRDDTEQSR